MRERVDIGISNFRGGCTHVQMADALFAGGVPDVLAFSVLGWNFRAFGTLAETFKQLNPDGLVVFGGTHVANQADRVFRLFPDVDVVVNGEGELTFQELLRRYRPGGEPDQLAGVAGISWRSPAGPVDNLPRPRMEDLDIIPSPLLTGAIELTDAGGAFRYDVALMETNRGCPYKCSFCYWGGAVGQRVRAFSRSRLREELELLAKQKVHTVVVCDANFGMLPIDVEFVDDLIEVRDQYGFPRAFETSWAKNKSTVFYEIVHRMKDAGLQQLVHAGPPDARPGRHRDHEPAQHEGQRLGRPVRLARRGGPGLLRRADLGRPGRDRRVVHARLRRARRTGLAHRRLPDDAAAQHRVRREARTSTASSRCAATRTTSSTSWRTGP